MTLLLLAIKATLVIALTFALVAAARRARASVRHMLFASLFVFLLLLPVASRFVTRASFTVEVPEQVVRSAGSLPAVSPAASRPSADETFHWRQVLRDAYLTITGALLAWLALGVWRLRRMAARGEVWLDGTARMNALAARVGIRRAALVILSSDTAVPLTFGFRRSTIVVPRNATSWNDEELSRVFRHELEHVRREDWAAQLLARAVCAIYWAHPLVWIAWRRFCFEAERACDDAVVETFEGAEDYAGQLVNLAKSVRMPAMVPALGMASRSRLSERVHALLDRTQRRGPLGRLAMASAVAMTLLLLVTVAPVRLIAAAVSDERPSYRSGKWSWAGEKLAEAGEVGDIEQIRQMLDAGIDVNTVAEGDGTALIGAARGGQLETVRFLIDRGADVNLASPGDGNPLIMAAEKGHLEIVELLLDRGAEIDRLVPGDENPIIQAAWHGHERVVELLLRRGADVNAKAWEQGRLRTALRMARNAGHDRIVRMLTAAGARE